MAFYRIISKSFGDTEIQACIFNTFDFTAIELDGAASPIELKIIDNSEDPYTVIKSTQCILRFNSTPSVNMSTFSTGADNNWLVIISRGPIFDGIFLFVGYLVMNDIREDFMPVPNIVQLTATDGLGLLKDIPLTDFNGSNPSGHYRIIDFIAWCLKKSVLIDGIELQINVAYNIKLSGLISDISIPNTDREHLFDTVYLWAKTFEDEIDTCINCYEVLQRILGESAVLFQRDGQWWIVRIEEFTAATGETSEDIETIGSEEITNGDFTGSATDWVLGISWTYSSNNVEHVVSTSGAFYQAGALEEGELYEVTMDVGGTVGTVSVFLDGGPTVGVGSPGTTLTFRGVWNTSSGHKIRIVPTSDFDGTIDNVSVKKVTTSTVVTDAANRGFYVTTFDQNGTFIGNLGEKQYFKDIGKDDPYTIFFSKEQTEVTNDRPHKFAKETFEYELPKEIPTNKDFERGDIIDDSNPNSIKYTIDQWRFAIYQRNGGTPDAGIGDAYILKTFNNLTYEVERFVVMEKGAGVHDPGAIKSEGIPVQLGDKIGISLDFKFDVDFGDTLSQTIAVELQADDGTYWYMLETGFWFVYPGGAGLLIPLNNPVTPDLIDTEWNSITVIRSNEIPRDGIIYIYLLQSDPEGATNMVMYQNLQFDYYPLINGSHTKYTGQYNQVTRTTDPEDYKAKRDEKVYMSDSPKALFKGAMFRVMESLFTITTDTTDFFATDHRINLPGDYTLLFYKGQEVQIDFSVSNNLIIHIVSVTYDGGSNTTDIIVSDILVDESGATASFFLPRFVLTSVSILEQQGFYDASIYPDGVDPIIRPFGELQIFDVWDQFAEDKRIFEATCQGLDLAVTDVESLVGSAHLLYKWSFRDTSLHTNNRVFYLLTFNQNLRNVGWTGTFREVANSTRPKQYEGNIFKYISK